MSDSDGEGSNFSGSEPEQSAASESEVSFYIFLTFASDFKRYKI